MGFEPRYYQTEAFEAVRSAIKNYKGPCYIEASVGAPYNALITRRELTIN